MPLEEVEHLPRWAKFKFHTPHPPHLNADKVIAEHWLIKMDL